MTEINLSASHVQDITITEREKWNGSGIPYDNNRDRNHAIVIYNTVILISEKTSGLHLE